MSVLIKGMDMPNCCRHCELLINCDGCEGYKCFCSAMGSEIGYFENLSKTQLHKDCPLVPVPTPHGRLADIDEFRKDNIEALRNAIGQALEKHGFLSDKVRMYEEAVQDVLANIENCPTVIESEE